MRILHTTASLDPVHGGPARSVPQLAITLAQAGHNVGLWCPQSIPVGVADLFESRHCCLTVLSGPFNQCLEKFYPEIVHDHGLWLPFHREISCACKHHSVQKIISPRGMLEPWARNYRRWKKEIAWLLYQRRNLQVASVLHATSVKETANLLSLGFKIPVAVIPNGVDVPIISQSAVYSENIKTALFLGRIHVVKGLINLVKAWGKIRPSNWRVVIAGPDEDGHQAEIEREISKHNLTNSFKFIGQVTDEEKWEHYNRADLFILPTHTENFGIVVAEALASGTPVITTKGAPWVELEEYRCGWWIDIGIEPLAKAISKAISLSTEERLKMGQRGQKLVMQNYSWDHIGKSMTSVYKWMLNAGTPPECVITDQK